MSVAGTRAGDASGGRHAAFYEPGVVFFLEGPRSGDFCSHGEKNRAAHFASGRLRARIDGVGDQYSVSFWFWNGMPIGARETTGWMFSRDVDHGLGLEGDHVGLGGSGKLVFFHGREQSGTQRAAGRTPIERWTWNHVVFAHDGPHVRIYLNGDPAPQIDVTSPVKRPMVDQFFFGGRADNVANWEGLLDEIAVFDRFLSAPEVQALANPPESSPLDALSSIELD